MQISVLGMYIYLYSYICLCTWLLMTDQRRLSSSAPVRPGPSGPPAITDPDWHFTIAHACIATALDMCNVPVDGGATQKQSRNLRGGWCESLSNLNAPVRSTSTNGPD